jgi:hypothetical protein
MKESMYTKQKFCQEFLSIFMYNKIITALVVRFWFIIVIIPVHGTSASGVTWCWGEYVAAVLLQLWIHRLRKTDRDPHSISENGYGYAPLNLFSSPK